MKLRCFAIVLALSLAVWAQESPSTSAPNATPKTETKSCCHHSADAKDGMSCCHHANADAKDSPTCCTGNKCDVKDGKSCCGGKEMADAKCCVGKDAKKCAEQCKKNGGCKDGKCCGGEKTSSDNCCGNKCEHVAEAATASLFDSHFDRR